VLSFDLVRGVMVTPEGGVLPFDFAESKRDRILHGLDEIALTLQHEDAIAAYEHAHGIA
jgi:3-isopropylmalate/(R)-2-methylmalate dehydratase small subunit